MADIPYRPQVNAEHYVRQRGLVLLDALGGGVNGSVWYTNLQSAVKVFEAAEAYERERNVYFRLTDSNITFINEFAVPQLRGFDDDLRVIEMDVVRPHFVLDFAGTYLDKPPDFTSDALAEHETSNSELYGDKWPRVRLLLAKLRSMGIYYIDINRGNIRFPEFDDESESQA
jgi:hypothetical protein